MLTFPGYQISPGKKKHYILYPCSVPLMCKAAIIFVSMFVFCIYIQCVRMMWLNAQIFTITVTVTHGMG